jgi:DNA-binding NtrC family response regulator
MAKILIVEDEGIIALNTENALVSMGHQVVGTAGNGDRAVEIAAKESPDIILMDIALQGRLDGVETAELLCDKYPGCRIIYMTAHTDPKSIKRAKKTRHVGFLQKPFETFQLQQLIEQALGQQP